MTERDMRQRKSRAMPNDIKALRAFVRAAERMNDRERMAAIRYLVSRYADSGYGIIER